MQGISTGASNPLIYSFNGKPQALLKNFAYACGSPLNENDQYMIKSATRWRTPAVF
jgi:hypothetical protein